MVSNWFHPIFSTAELIVPHAQWEDRCFRKKHSWGVPPFIVCVDRGLILLLPLGLSSRIADLGFEFMSSTRNKQLMIK